jgi:hypothetical protein
MTSEHMKNLLAEGEGIAAEFSDVSTIQNNMIWSC